MLQLSEAFSGNPIDHRVEVTDGFGTKPLHKRGGFYVFTGEMPERNHITSDFYCDTQVDITGARQRLQLVQKRGLWPRGATGCRLMLKPWESVHLYAGTRSYKLNADISPGDTRLSLYKTDLDDITWLYHALRGQEGSFGEPFLITESLGSGVYSVETAFTENIARAGCAISPLSSMTADGAGELVFPLPEESSLLYVFRKNGVTELRPQKSEMNIINLED